MKTTRYIRRDTYRLILDELFAALYLVLAAFVSIRTPFANRFRSCWRHTCSARLMPCWLQRSAHFWSRSNSVSDRQHRSGCFPL